MFWIPQMMPMYWLVICLLVNLSIYFFSCSYYFNVFIYSHSFPKMKKGSQIYQFSFIK